MSSWRGPLVVAWLALAAAGCGGSTSVDASDGGGGAAGSGGAGGTAGSAGSGGTAGSAGTGGTAGSGGGGGAASPECHVDADCVLENDCCACSAFPAGTTLPDCPGECLVASCTGLSIPDAKPVCVAGQCVLDADCDLRHATCKSLPQPCPAGQARIVAPGTSCWGGCLPSTECSAVTDCSACSGSTCVTWVGAPEPVRCLPTPLACAAGASCDCMGAVACTGSYSACYADPGTAGLLCNCSVCGGN